ncbi:MAG: monovalent cation:proton antiporter-2 (CPA2) family protein [Devosiaceae bacterium]|nr:monovalent cation:proton antiporter-2 (CPA2) family protein [Devosiaceae bacterium]
MENSPIFVDILVFLAAAIIIVPIFQRIKVSPILGYLAAGVIIGPFGLALISDSERAHTLAEFGVVFLLFMIGLELSLERLRSIGIKIFLLGLAQVVISSIVLSLIAFALGLPAKASIIIGTGLALSSTAFVMKYLSEKGERATRFGLIVFAILLVQDLAVVPFLILVDLLGNEGSSFVEAFGGAAVRGTIALIVVVVLGRVLLKPLYKMIASTRSSELFVSATLLVVLGTGWIMTLAGLSMTLGAFLAGVLLSETQYRHQIEADIRPFRGILLGLFFMMIGMSIDISLVLEQWLIISGLLIGLLLTKTIIIVILSKIMGNKIAISIKVGLALAQGGEFGFVMFGAALTLGLIAVNLANILLATIALSMIVTPLMFSLGKFIEAKINRDKEASTDIIDSEERELTAQVLIAGFGRVGQTVAKVLSDANISYIALDLDQNRVAKCRKNGMNVFYGDADQIKVLQSAGADQVQVAVITLDSKITSKNTVSSLRKNYPQLPIYVRAKDRKQGRILEEAGASAMVSEAAEASLQLGSIVLASLNVSADEIASVMDDYREDDYALLEEIISA